MRLPRKRQLMAVILMATLTVATYVLTLLLPLRMLRPWRNLLATFTDDGIASKYHLFHYDASNKYKVVPFVAVGSMWSSLSTDNAICLATHVSVERMYSVAETLASWSGPASVALYVPGPDASVMTAFLRRLRTCNREAFERTAFHVVFPIDRPPEEIPLNAAKEDGKLCEISPKEMVEGLISGIPSRTYNVTAEFLYPQNLARNTARERCPSDWVLNVDADMIPSLSLAKRLKTFLSANSSRECSKCAYVVPTYEVQPSKEEPGWSVSSSLPDTKEDLMTLVKKRLARPFHVSVFKLNQEASQLSKWEKIESKGNENISVAYDVPHFPFWYEPVHVTRHGVPPYDERFVGFGMTRNTQAYEMFLDGYKFKVLGNAFLVHWRFQYLKQRPPWREKQSQTNYERFKPWILEKSVRYDSDPRNLIKTVVGDQKKRKVMVVIRS